MRLPHDTHAFADTPRAKTLALLLFAAVGLAAYANVLNNYFLSDDFVLMGRALAGDMSAIWGREHGGFFRPVFTLSYVLDGALWGRRPLGFHLTNVALHATNSFLVFLLARRLFSGSDAGHARPAAAALVAGLAFLLHPSHTEAVTWISGRVDLLAALFGLAALLFYCHVAGERRRAWLALSLCCLALALLAKESAAFIPLAIFLLGARAAGGAGLRRALAGGAKEAAPFALVLLAYVIVRAAMLGALVGGYGADHHLNFTHSMIVSQLLRYPLRAFFPALVLRNAPFLESRLLSPILIVVGAVAVSVAALALSRAGARKRFAAFARRNAFLWTLTALFFCALVPVINLRIDVFTTHGERYLYFPSAFFCMALAHVGLKASQGRSRALAVVLCLLACYTATLWLTNRYWVETARLARAIQEDISTQSNGEDIVVLNAPDNFDGAHLFRNGLPEALRWFVDGRHFADARVVAWHGLRSARGGATLREEGSGIFTLELENVDEAFGRVDENIENVETLEHDERHLRVRIKRSSKPTDIFYFNAGRMVKVGD
jgi:hypothetical protein